METTNIQTKEQKKKNFKKSKLLSTKCTVVPKINCADTYKRNT